MRALGIRVVNEYSKIDGDVGTNRRVKERPRTRSEQDQWVRVSNRRRQQL